MRPMDDNSESAGTGGAEINLNPEVSFDIVVPLYHYTTKYDVRIDVGTARDKFVVRDEMGTEIMVVSFKQVRSGNANFKSNLWYKIKGTLFAFVEERYPSARITKEKEAFTEEFTAQFRKKAKKIMAIRARIEDELGALPHAFQAFIDQVLPRANDGLAIVDGSALMRYNDKAKRKRWPTLRNLEELAFLISQAFPSFQCRAARTQYIEKNGNRQRKVAIKCDVTAIAREIERILDEITS